MVQRAIQLLLRIFQFFCKGCRSVLSPSQTQPASHQLSGDPMCNKGTGLVLEIFAGSCRLSKACRGISLQALSVDKDLSRAENAVVAKYDLCDENHSNWRAWSRSSGIGSCMRTLRPAAVQLPKQGSAWSQDCLKSGNRGSLGRRKNLMALTI